MRTLSRSGFRVWSRNDIESALAALDQANKDVALAVDSYELQLYRQGYVAAIRSFAQMFGIDSIPERPTSNRSSIRTIDSNVSVMS